ncbi:MAG: DUF1998 domain-containing protein [Dehalococcoidia bacterium]|nr:DUF1998 domain-containing protein [Dehalococcoidia bacterium]
MPCDARDVGGEPQVRADTGLPTVFYDAVPGGVGLAGKLFEIREQLIDACLETLESCDCEGGCPGCVGPQVEAESPAKGAARTLLQRLVG